MPTPEPTFWDYVRSAFNRRPSVRGLGEVPWNKIVLAALAILGIGNPGFWLLGLGGELFYLYVMATNPRFQTLVRAEKLQAERVSAEDRVVGRLAELSKEGQERFQDLRTKCAEVQQITETIQAGPGPSATRRFPVPVILRPCATPAGSHPTRESRAPSRTGCSSS